MSDFGEMLRTERLRQFVVSATTRWLVLVAVAVGASACSQMNGVDRFIRIPAGDKACIPAALASLDPTVDPMPEGGAFHEGAFEQVWAKRISRTEVQVSSANVYVRDFTELEYARDEGKTARVAERIVERCGKPETLMRCERRGTDAPCSGRPAR